MDLLLVAEDDCVPNLKPVISLVKNVGGRGSAGESLHPPVPLIQEDGMCGLPSSSSAVQEPAPPVAGNTIPLASLVIGSFWTMVQ